jgi:hypothetical protein
MDLETIRNYQEIAVCDLITASAARYPALASRPGLLSDVACVALNSLKPRYIKHNVDLHFFETPAERARNDLAGRSRLPICLATDRSGGARRFAPAPSFEMMRAM